MNRLDFFIGLASILFISGCATGMEGTARHAYTDWRAGCIRDISYGNCATNPQSMPANPDFSYIMSSGRFKMVRVDKTWKIDASELMRDDTLFAVLGHLKSSLYNGDRGTFLSLISDDLRHQYGGLNDKEFIQCPELNDLYASIAATVNPLFEIEEKKATCNLSGKVLVFEMINNVWTLVYFS